MNTTTAPATAGLIRGATQADEPAVVATLVTAFSSDPAARWAWPEAQAYLTHFPAFVKAFGGGAFRDGTADVVDGGGGAALWLRPGAQPDEDALAALIAETVEPELRLDVFGVIEEMGSYHPGEPHWYLPMIGIDVPLQGQGFGSALLRHALARCDRDRVPTYLESSNPRNVPLYQRHGFELVGTIQVGTSPQIYPMVRKPGSSKR